MKNYNGLVQLEVNRLSGIAEAEYVKQQAALLPQTFAAFCGSSGRSAKIWVLFALPDGTTPKRESDATLFHAHAYRMAVKCYQLTAVCHYIERTFPYPELPHDSGRISILQSCRCTFLPGTAPRHARGRELPATKTRRKESAVAAASGQ